MTTLGRLPALGFALLLGAWPGCEAVIDPIAPRFEPEEPPPITSCLDETAVQTQVFQRSCGTSACHDARSPRAGLDLVSPRLRERIEGRLSVHDACADTAILVPGSPEESLLVTKILGTHGACGEPMPFSRDLDPAAVRCVAEWVVSLEP